MKMGEHIYILTEINSLVKLKLLSIIIHMPENFTLKQLERAKWFLEHKKQLKTALIWALIILNIILWGISIYLLVNYIKGEGEYEKMIKELAESEIEIQRNPPEELLILKEFFLPNKTKYDLIALIENPNENWFVKEFEYDSKKSFILPNSQRYLRVVGIEKSAHLTLGGISWQRVKSEERKLLEILPQVKIEDQNISFLELENKEKVLKTSFTLNNQSVYSFWEMNLGVALYKGKEMIGFTNYLVSKLNGGEKRNIEIIWDKINDVPTHIGVLPEVNVFDPNVFMTKKY